MRENFALLVGVSDHLLRVPLHGHEEWIFAGRFQRFDKTIF
jgi:hypothetical protein